MDSEARVDDRPSRHLLVIDHVASIILLLVQPVVAIVLYFLATLTVSSSFYQTRSVPQWAVATVIVLVFAVPLVAAGFTIARIVNDRIAFWVPSLAMALTTLMVHFLSVFAASH
ncbi:hypothetical protein KRR55_11485 [Paeniglutamicibacter sp. ABSL32-1]|uniref:hypothetical protein n=1 Tax=Paeniglutamicibacter quisquiliarum TaxID=2849498 RepID=UPI001C2D4B21|nr:hypothetical protein [Paeniglutamicibacter quisquiliarum]MBV1779733.1 hypothetical protein [Paeniglutamicibacter quisquiliarum]